MRTITERHSERERGQQDGNCTYITPTTTTVCTYTFVDLEVLRVHWPSFCRGGEEYCWRCRRRRRESWCWRQDTSCGDSDCKTNNCVVIRCWQSQTDWRKHAERPMYGDSWSDYDRPAVMHMFITSIERGIMKWWPVFVRPSVCRVPLPNSRMERPMQEAQNWQDGSRHM